MALVLVEALPQAPMADRHLEVVERKGIGHPDTICDSLVEAISIGLNRLYLGAVGAIAHYNIDKALLVAGQCDKAFGRGRVTKPMELIVGDRATFVADVEARARNVITRECAHMAEFCRDLIEGRYPVC